MPLAHRDMVSIINGFTFISRWILYMFQELLSKLSGTHIVFIISPWTYLKKCLMFTFIVMFNYLNLSRNLYDTKEGNDREMLWKNNFRAPKFYDSTSGKVTTEKRQNFMACTLHAFTVAMFMNHCTKTCSHSLFTFFYYG